MRRSTHPIKIEIARKLPLGGAVGALLLPTLVIGTSFLIGFAAIGVAGLVAGLIALRGPKTSGRFAEEGLTQTRGRLGVVVELALTGH